MICVDLAGVGMSQPDKVLFADIDLSVSVGDRVGLVGINGSGKTTLLRILAGELVPTAGVVRFGRDVRIAYLAQDPQLPAGTVGDVLGASWEVAAMASRLGVDELRDRPTTQLSGGQAKRVALATVLAAQQQERFDMVVLDEPTNHLDLEAIEWLEQQLARMASALVVVTHDRHALDRWTTTVGPSRLVELDGGRAFVHRATQGSSAYATYLEGRSARIEQEEREESTRKVLARRELAWLRRGAPARSSKPKARLRTAHRVVDGGPRPTGVRGAALDLDAGTTRLGNQVVELDGVGQRFGEGAGAIEVFSDVDLLIEPGARLAVVGPNGSGKTTLLDIIAGRAVPTAGEVRTGKTVVVGYADQHAADFDEDAIVRELVAGPYREPNHEDRALLERFWFDATAQYAPIRMLSGGERRRLQLVLVLATKPNLLVLDEPTNDLDLDTLRALESFLADWPGALVVASHDRAFLDIVADHVLAIEPGGQVRRVPGGVAGWLAERSASPQSTTSAERRPKGDTRLRTAPAGPSPSTLGRRLRETEQAVAKAQRRVDRLTEQLAGLAERAAAHDEIAAVGADLAAAQLELDELEAAWFELAEQLG